MVRARQTPKPPPIAKPRTTRNHAKNEDGGRKASVVSTAMPMPIMPKRLPWREVAGDDKPRNARMKRTPATR